MCAGAAAQKLLELYKYESSRDPAHFSDAVYNANAHVLLHDDSCFRFESREAEGTLTIQLLDPDRTEVAPGGSLIHPADLIYLLTWQMTASALAGALLVKEVGCQAAAACPAQLKQL